MSNLLPNITLDRARDMLSELRRDLDRAINKRNIAQSVAFDLLYKDEVPTSEMQLKAETFNAKQELKQIVEQRDKLKAENRRLKAENKAFREQFKLTLSEETHETDTD